MQIIKRDGNFIELPKTLYSKSQLLYNLADDGIMTFNVYEQSIDHSDAYDEEMSFIRDFMINDINIAIVTVNGYEYARYATKDFLKYFSLTKKEASRLRQLGKYLMYKKLEIVMNEVCLGKDLFNTNL